MKQSLQLMRLDREFDLTIVRGVEIILEAVEGGDEEAAAWLIGRDVEAATVRYAMDGLLDTGRLRAAVSRARELVAEAVR